jgi:hypothetical protein
MALLPLQLIEPFKPLTQGRIRAEAVILRASLLIQSEVQNARLLPSNAPRTGDILHADAVTALSESCRFILWEMEEIVLGTQLQLTQFTFKKTQTSFGQHRQISLLDHFGFLLAEPTKRCSHTAGASRAFGPAMMGAWFSQAVLIVLQF